MALKKSLLVTVPLGLALFSLVTCGGWRCDTCREVCPTDAVVVEYADGTTDRLEPAWSRPFGDWVGGRSVSASLPGVVSRHVGHRLTLTGRLEETAGAAVPFEVSASFEPESKSWNGANLMYHNE